MADRPRDPRGADGGAFSETPPAVRSRGERPSHDSGQSHGQEWGSSPSRRLPGIARAVSFNRVAHAPIAKGREPGLLHQSGARTSALQTPVVACLGAGEDLHRFIALTARSGQATRRLLRRRGHTGERSSRGLPSLRFPANAPTWRSDCRKPQSMARPA
jgi:hypothetical protein